ncbi:MAG: O-antigen ligase family protein [Flavobacteriaceae bacterium]|nr:O-antigen ligase family protein [Flavobacteriaceae bacterium]
MEKKKKSNLDLFSLVVFLGMILLLSSKTIIVCLLLLIIIYFVFYKTSKKVLMGNKKIILIVVIVMISSSKYVIERFSSEMDSNFIEVLNVEKVNHTYAWTGSTIRLLQLRFLKEQIYENKIFLKGFGLFASRESLEKKHLQLGTYPTYHDYNYHNMYAQMLAELGLLGLLLLLTMLILNLSASVKKRSFLFFSFSLIMVIWFISESVLWVQKGLFMFIIIYCLLYRNTLTSK